MKQATIYSLWFIVGFASLIVGVWCIGGVGAALVTFGSGLIAAAIMGFRHDQEPE